MEAESWQWRTYGGLPPETHWIEELELPRRLKSAMTREIYRLKTLVVSGHYQGGMRIPPNELTSFRQDLELWNHPQSVRLLMLSSVSGLANVGSKSERLIAEAIAKYIGPPPDSLDRAWRDAEAALPEGWRMRDLGRDGDEGWLARAHRPYVRGHVGFGATPAAALRSLAAKLREG